MKHKTLHITKNHFEKLAWQDARYVCGIDEVGRGCLAGPVVVAAVILPDNTTYKLLKDSKIMTEEERITAYDWITKHCFWTASYAHHALVDHRNIYQATLYAMRKAYIQLIETLPFALQQLKFVVTDAMPLSLDLAFSHEQLEFHHFIKGETFSTSIAAASIVAKVTRDRLMQHIAQFFPAFSFEQHKGYATKTHIAALQKQGATVIHRRTFITELTQACTETTLQQSLFNESL